MIMNAIKSSTFSQIYLPPNFISSQTLFLTKSLSFGIKLLLMIIHQCNVSRFVLNESCSDSLLIKCCHIFSK